MIRDLEEFKAMWDGLATDPVGTVHHAFGAEVRKENETQVAFFSVSIAKQRDGKYLPVVTRRYVSTIGEVDVELALTRITESAAEIALHLTAPPKGVFDMISAQELLS